MIVHCFTCFRLLKWSSDAPLFFQTCKVGILFQSKTLSSWKQTCFQTSYLPDDADCSCIKHIQENPSGQSKVKEREHPSPEFPNSLSKSRNTTIIPSICIVWSSQRRTPHAPLSNMIFLFLGFSELITYPIHLFHGHSWHFDIVGTPSAASSLLPQRQQTENITNSQKLVERRSKRKESIIQRRVAGKLVH